MGNKVKNCNERSQKSHTYKKCTWLARGLNHGHWFCLLMQSFVHCKTFICEVAYCIITKQIVLFLSFNEASIYDVKKLSSQAINHAQLVTLHYWQQLYNKRRTFFQFPKWWCRTLFKINYIIHAEHVNNTCYGRSKWQFYIAQACKCRSIVNY